MNKHISSLSKLELTEKYIGIFQPLEAIVVLYYRQYPELHDHDVLRAYEALLKYIKAKLTNYPLPQYKLVDFSQKLFEILFMFIESMENSYSHREIQECLKTLEKSLKLWNSSFGSRGYLNYISEFN